MPNSRFSPKDDRQISHIKSSEMASGMSPKKAESVAYGALVNQQKAKKKKPAWQGILKNALK